MNPFDQIDKAIERLNQLESEMIRDHNDSNLLERLLTKDEWSEAYYEKIKTETLKRKLN